MEKTCFSQSVARMAESEKQKRNELFAQAVELYREILRYQDMQAYLTRELYASARVEPERLKNAKKEWHTFQIRRKKELSATAIKTRDIEYAAKQAHIQFRADSLLACACQLIGIIQVGNTFRLEIGLMKVGAEAFERYKMACGIGGM